MSYESDPMGAALDRHITGNWGEDSVGDDRCDNCDDRDECPFDLDTVACSEDLAADEADRAYDLARDLQMDS